MDLNLEIVSWLCAEASKLQEKENPFEGSKKRPGDLPVGKLVESEFALFRLVGSLFDQIMRITGGREISVLSPEEKIRIDHLSYLHKFVTELAVLNVKCRLGWQYPDLGFLEDGTIVSFLNEPPGENQVIRAVVVDIQEIPPPGMKH